MPFTEAMRSSVYQDWETPQELFDQLHGEFHFEMDLAASADNAKCARFLSLEQDSLSCEWRRVGWLNPPYGRGGVARWLSKALEESERWGTTIVCLINCRTDTRYWHDVVMQSSEVRFIRGRLHFRRSGQSADAAPFPSAIVVFRGGENGQPSFRTWDREACDG